MTRVRKDKLIVKSIAVLGAIVVGQFGYAEVGNESAVGPDRLNDTGITWGADYPRGVNEDCSAAIDRERLPAGAEVEGDILSQQDCTRGRDKVLDNDSDGAAGFEYRKVGGEGGKLPADAGSWHCVLDETTGLLWEVKRVADGVYGNSGLHDGDDRFTWYNPIRSGNGGAIGDWNRRHDQCAGYAAETPTTYCNTNAFVSRVNKHGLCGFSDWRLPTRTELAGLVHFGRASPAIDTVYFPNTRAGFYWTASPDAKLKGRAWAIKFQFGYAAPMPRDNGRFVRLVRDWGAETGQTNQHSGAK